MVGAWARVEGTDWVCIAEIDHDEAFAPLFELTRTTLYLSLVDRRARGRVDYLARRADRRASQIPGRCGHQAGIRRSIRPMRDGSR